MSVLAEFSIFPMDKGESVSNYVARAVKIVQGSGLPYALGSMGTCIEGEWEQVNTVIDSCFKALQEDCDRINLSVKVDYRKKGRNRLTTKVASVKAKL